MNTTNQQSSYSERIAAFAASAKYEKLPAEVATKVKTHIMDAIGVGMAGSTMDWCRNACGLFGRLGGAPDATMLGYKDRTAAPNAAIANGIAIACMDYDDTDYKGGGCHMSRSVVSAALAVAEMCHSSGKDLVAAVTVGYETAGRVGSALLLDRYGPRSASASWTADDLAKHQRMQQQGGALVRGFIPGLYACSVAAAMLLGLNARQIASAQGLVGGLGLFLGQTHREGADALMLHAGWAAHAGILAALWARDGLIGPRFIYEGDRGVLSVIGLDLQDASRLDADLGTSWACMNNVLKFYPAAHGTHHFIESLKSLMNEYKFQAGDVDQIECRAPSQRVEFHFLPVEAKLNPTPYTGRFSMPYLLARLLVDSDLGPLSFTPEKVTEPAVLELARRVTYISDETVWYGDKRGMVTVKLFDGRTFTRSTPDLLGFPKRPNSQQDVSRKFRVNAQLVFNNQKKLGALVNALEGLEDQADVANFMALTAPD